MSSLHQTDAAGSHQAQMRLQVPDLPGKDFSAADNALAALSAFGYLVPSRNEAADGPQTYFMTRWGMERELEDVVAADAFAIQAKEIQ